MLASACTRAQAPGPVAPNVALEAVQRDDTVKSVYAEFAGPAVPLAEALCDALHGLPERRRVACCAAHPGTSIHGECSKIVSAALLSGAVTLDAAAVRACAAAQEGTLEGCAWIGQGEPPLPPACTGLFKGTVKAHGVCRSALECAEGQTCLGSGPTAAGRCGPPKGDGQACLSSIDPLSTYTRDSEDPRHPECAGFCGHRRCEPRRVAGAACFLARHCGPGLHCDGATCVSGPTAAAGGACVDDACAPGLRCLSGRCGEARAEGLACKQDFECRGGCLPGKQVCGMRCDLR
jgi:hypothetical protein